MVRWCGAFLVACVAFTGSAFAEEAMHDQGLDPLTRSEMAEVRAGGQGAWAPAASPNFSRDVPAVSLENVQGVTVVQLNGGVNSQQSAQIDVDITFTGSLTDSASAAGLLANAR